jgi:alpha-beta hydrolase superfamily lysophospholipase
MKKKENEPEMNTEQSNQQHIVQEKPQVSTKRKIYRVIIVITLIYCSVGIALYHLQEKLLFHPVTLSQNFQFKFDVPFKEVNIPMNKTDAVNMIQFLPADPAIKGVVLYFHGNSDNVIRYEKNAEIFTKKGYEVWIPDYPTYGKTTGELTEENMYLQAKEVYKLAHSKFSSDSIFVYGKSLGTGVASYIAAKEKCAALILETPFYSIPSLFSTYAPIYPTSRMSHFKFPVGEYLGEVTEPVLIFSGTSDKVIPYRNAAKLKKVLKKGDEFITLQNGTHNNVTSFPIFQEKIDSVFDSKR